MLGAMVLGLFAPGYVQFPSHALVQVIVVGPIWAFWATGLLWLQGSPWYAAHRLGPG